MASERLLKALTARDGRDVRLNEAEIQFCDEIFKRFDFDQDQQLSRGELREVFSFLQTSGRIQTRHDDIGMLAKQAMGAFDVDDDDQMSFPEFCLLFDTLRRRWPDSFKFAEDQTHAGASGTLDLKTSTVRNQNQNGVNQGDLVRLEEPELRRIFGMFDKDGSGSLDVDEVRTVAYQIGIPDFERDQYKGFLLRTCRTVSSDMKGKVEFHDFKSLLESLITCKVDRGYRKRVLRQKISGNVNMAEVVNSSNPHKRNI